jgi:hypothetical protein
MNQVFLAPLSAEEQTVFFDLIQRVSDAAEGLRNPTEPLTTQRQAVLHRATPGENI